MRDIPRRRACLIAAVAAALVAGGCDAGSENDNAFLKEAGVGAPIPEYDKGYASRKEQRQAAVDAADKQATKRRSPRGNR